MKLISDEISDYPKVSDDLYGQRCEIGSGSWRQKWRICLTIQRTRFGTELSGWNGGSRCGSGSGVVLRRGGGSIKCGRGSKFTAFSITDGSVSGCGSGSGSASFDDREGAVNFCQEISKIFNDSYNDR